MQTGRQDATDGAYVLFVIRARNPLPSAAAVAAGLTARLESGLVPEMDVEHRTVTIPADPAGKTSRPIADAIVAAVDNKCGIRPWVAMVPSAHTTDPEGTAVGERWIEVVAELGGPRVVELHDFLAAQKMLEDPVWAADLASILAPLAAYDRHEKTQLLRTLDEILLEGRTRLEVEKRRGINRHTVTRHLKTASEILGRDVRSGVDRILIAQALMARRALKRSPKERKHGIKKIAYRTDQEHPRD